MLPCFDDITAPSAYGFVIDESEAEEEEDSDKPDFVTAPDKTFAGRGPLVLWTAVGGASSPESQRLIISHSGGIALW